MEKLESISCQMTKFVKAMIGRRLSYSPSGADTGGGTTQSAVPYAQKIAVPSD